MADRLNIYVVEDMAITRRALELKLIQQDHVVIGSAANAEVAWHEIRTHTVDLVLIDIHLAGEKDGIWLARQIRTSLNLPFIFLTAFGDDKTLEQVVGTQPNGYLMKPYNDATLLTTIRIAMEKAGNNELASQDQHIELRDGYTKALVAQSKIHYLQSDGNYVHVYLDIGSHIVRTKLDDLLNELNSEVFIKIHQRYAVNRHKIERIASDYFVVLGVDVPISRKHKKHLPESLKARK